MKFALTSGLLRHAAPDETPDNPATSDTAPPGPPRGRPVSVYAAILDGRSLWLALAATPGSLALRETVSGDVHALRSDLPEDKPAYRSVRVDLTDLPQPQQAEASYDVVLVPPGGRAARPVWTHPLPSGGPVHPLTAPDGESVFELRRAGDGTLQVHRSHTRAALVLRWIDNVPGGIRIDLDTTPGAPRAGGDLLFLGDEGVLASFPTATDEQGLHAVVTLEAVPGDAVGFARVAVGTPDSWLPVVRRRNDLADPASAVMLPVLYGADAERPRLRMRYSPDAQLAVRLLEPA